MELPVTLGRHVCVALNRAENKPNQNMCNCGNRRERQGARNVGRVPHEGVGHAVA
jgi:hypothetical protein